MAINPRNPLFLLIASLVALSLVNIQRLHTWHFQETIVHESRKGSPALKFFILDAPQYTSRLIQNDSEMSSSYYREALNEESAEIWLHRGFDRMTYEDGHTLDPNETDVFLITGYAHLHESGFYKKPINASVYESLIVDPTKPHLLLMPTWNPSRSTHTGIKNLATALQSQNVSLWSVGFERNSAWQGVPTPRIIPIPYVVRQEKSPQEILPRTSNFVFFAGDPRRAAKKWGGCDREKMLTPLMNEIDMFLKVLKGKGNRLNQSTYNRYMRTSDYCLMLCGDTPTSRGLASAMVSGCIPIRVGSRLRGLCEPPCVQGWGWSVTGAEYPHLPYNHRIPWDEFPEIDEGNFTENGREVLNEVFQKYDNGQKEKMRKIMDEVREGWIYGWGDPVTSANFGNAYDFILDSFVSALRKENVTLPRQVLEV